MEDLSTTHIVLFIFGIFITFGVVIASFWPGRIRKKRLQPFKQKTQSYKMPSPVVPTQQAPQWVKEQKSEKTFEDAFVLQHKETLEQVYNDAIDFLEKTYPKARFRFMPLSVFLSTAKEKVQQGKNIEDVVKETQTYFMDSMDQDFINFSFELGPLPKISSNGENPGFWEAEVVNRYTSNGADPEDWNIRRLLVLERDGYRCRRCGTLLTENSAHIHHILPRSQGGNHALDNLVSLCAACHTCMPDHQFMRQMALYSITGNVLHSEECQAFDKRQARRATVSRLMDENQGLKFCLNCSSENGDEKALSAWQPEIKGVIAAYISGYQVKPSQNRKEPLSELPPSEVVKGFTQPKLAQQSRPGSEKAKKKPRPASAGKS